ncbi:uncharacterized protein LOC106867357 [Octopus bimaculoides]|uniref:uncharacterized protein LOC106867357 n=1 Tax=Octopus bimaculoides TaxID=37653 RepID=UPI00071D400E|nr:uncharacterized protein LOC106867357 [Octopus bimaculoides]|eukprot:XP_014767691.1 PREDICTED: uncharacterized protein LOC106867357 [Octopus bimaculoides]
MAVDRNTIKTLHRGGESNTIIAKELNVNRKTVWKIVKKFSETGSTIDQHGRDRERSVRTPQLIKSTTEKIRRNPHRSLRKVAATIKIRRASMYRLLKEDLRTYPYKMIHHKELTQVYKALRLKRGFIIFFQVAESTLSNLVFTDEQ